MPTKKAATVRNAFPNRSELAPDLPSGRFLGAHMSAAGGVHRAVERGYVAGCNALQVFTKNNNQWAAKPITDEMVAAYQSAKTESGIGPVVAHASYLINLATQDDVLFAKSLAALRDELLRCEQLGIPHLVFHPGAHVGAGEEVGIARVVEALDQVHRDLPNLEVKATVENTAGQGTCVGHRLEHLEAILDRVQQPERLAFCIDTCHLLAAGYDFREASGYAATFQEIEQRIGCDRVEWFHLNDSKKELGSRVDRHEEIGDGEVGIEGFRLLMNDPRFERTPMVLETPKGKDPVAADTTNLRRLVELIAVPT